MWEAHRYHDISTGHRVFGHESKCAHAHGHNYRIHFHCRGNLDSIGRVIDFSDIKERLCMWLEDYWDHKFLVWEQDTWAKELKALDPDGVVIVPFNPTAENMAQFLVEVIAPAQLEGTGIDLVKCIIEETRKCSAVFSL